MAKLSLVLCSVLMVVAGQLLFKLLGLKIQRGIALLEPRLIGIALTACVIYATATVLWIYLLRTLPLTKAYPFMALSFVLVPLGGVLFFSEAVRLPYMLGVALIVAGVLLTVWPSSH